MLAYNFATFGPSCDLFLCGRWKSSAINDFCLFVCVSRPLQWLAWSFFFAKQLWDNCYRYWYCLNPINRLLIFPAAGNRTGAQEAWSLAMSRPSTQKYSQNFCKRRTLCRSLNFSLASLEVCKIFFLFISFYWVKFKDIWLEGGKTNWT